MQTPSVVTYHVTIFGMFIIYFPTKFYVPCSSGSIVMLIKQKSNENLHTAGMLLFYILQITLTKLAYFSQSYFQASFQDPKLSISSTSQVRASALVSILIMGR
jgi:hypothetical protein